MTGLGSFLVNPLLAVLGAALVAAPILIHLLNKRKFKIVDWAAMDFLLDADKRNRRRLRLENLLLLLLRCLAVLLVGLLLARPFLSSELLPGGKDGGRFERIVLLDDSLSMQVRTGNGTALDDAKTQLIDIVRDFSKNRSDDTLTLVLTSHPDRTTFNNRSVTEKTVEEIVDTIHSLEASDATANLDVSLQAIQRQIASQPKNINRVLYVFTDMRKHDWDPRKNDSDSQMPLEGEYHPVSLLREMSKDLNGCFVIDVGRKEFSNLVVTDIKPMANDKTLISGVSSQFDVTVANRGKKEVRDVKVNFYSGQSLPLETVIETIAPGASETVAFRFNHTVDDIDDSEAGVRINSLKVWAEVEPGNSIDDDRLAADSQRHYAARVVQGIPALIVDGDPSADVLNSESIYLKTALMPPGDAQSGVLAKVVTETELENVDLERYKVIFLCNVYRLGEKQIAALEKWTADGGGLVIMPGDQVDDEYFNKWLHRDGKGLSPIRLGEILGDESELKWTGFKVENPKHPVLLLFEEEKNNPFLDKIKIFRWWSSTVLPEQRGSVVSTSIRFTDVDNSPAMVEKKYKKGRVLATTFPADDAWSNWVINESYIPTMIVLVNYMAGDLTGNSAVRVGEPIRQPLDLTLYDRRATLQQPGNKNISIDAVAGAGSVSPVEQAVWFIDHVETTRRGFYEFQLTRKRGGTQQVLYAANVDPREGDMKRLDLDALRRNLSGANVKLISGEQLSKDDIRGSQNEWWQYIWGFLLCVLGVELFLGWWFGRRR